MDRWEESKTGGETAARAAQVYEKLGLDPASKPTMTYSKLYDFLQEYGASKGLDFEQVEGVEDKAQYEPRTLDDLPMMGHWLQDNGPVIDLLAEAVRKPTYCMPVVGPRPQPVLYETIATGEMARAREFARMIVARANHRIGIGDIDGAIHDVITCKRLGRHLQYQDELLARLVGIAIEGIAAAVSVAAVRDSQPTNEQLQHSCGG